MKAGKYRIVGLQATGKTTLGKLLKERGYVVYDVDHTDGLTVLKDRETGLYYTFDDVDYEPDGTINWEKYRYEMVEGRLKELLKPNEPVFIVGSTRNAAESYSLFDKIFVLTIDADTMRKRLKTHEIITHHLDNEIERMTENFDEKQRKLLLDSGKNSVVIDSTKSVEQVLNDILSKI
ncbi:AAA family ATPase [Candidatus Saccharibacteria bacterium]|nr:AAA family ATPase [Candidatus Saccharibacteria bacterium]